ncbi:hypothetical protein CEXT_396931 [Caerostris extrusa]|uniref:Uncharacterized protein n=1 Tax=Caerostris extrusa TaxID=172846 RepID=A0AAV4QDP4_CAEEX|nr:hypothetical protein CEXT_396931 [Caerostris extrusa]
MNRSEEKKKIRPCSLATPSPLNKNITRIHSPRDTDYKISKKKARLHYLPTPLTRGGGRGGTEGVHSFSHLTANDNGGRVRGIPGTVAPREDGSGSGSGEESNQGYGCAVALVTARPFFFILILTHGHSL